MQSRQVILEQFKAYHELLKKLGSRLQKEKETRVALQSARITLLFQQSLFPLDGGMLSSPSNDDQGGYDKIFQCEAQFKKAQVELAALQKTIQQTEAKLIDTLSEKMTQNIIKIQTQQQIAGFSKRSGEVLLETLGQIQEAKSPTQLTMLSASMFQMLNFLRGVNTDVLKVDPVLQKAGHALEALKTLNITDRAAHKEVAVAMQKAREDFDAHALPFRQKLLDERAAKQEIVDVFREKIHKEQQKLKVIQDKIENIDQRLSTDKLSSDQRYLLEERVAQLKKQQKGMQDTVNDFTNNIHEAQETVKQLTGAIDKTKKIANTVHALCDLDVFKEDAELSPKLLNDSNTAIQEKLTQLSSQATGKPPQDSTHPVKDEAIQECMEILAQLSLIKYDDLVIEEHSSHEQGKELLQSTFLNGLLDTVGLYIAVAAPYADHIAKAYDFTSNVKKMGELYGKTQPHFDSEKTLLDTVTDYMKKNSVTIGLNSSVLTVAIVCFALFPPTTALGIIGIAMSGKSLALDLQDIMKYMLSEVSKTIEISDSLDKHSELLERLIKESKEIPLNKKAAALTVLQEAGLLMGEVIRETSSRSPEASLERTSSTRKSKTTLFSSSELNPRGIVMRQPVQSLARLESPQKTVEAPKKEVEPSKTKNDVPFEDKESSSGYKIK